MGGYWWKVCKLAAKQAAGLVGFGSAERAVVTVALQAAIAVMIYLLLGTTELRDNVGVRFATALAPLAVLPVIFAWKLLSVPAQLHKEQISEEDQQRRLHVFYLANMYVNEVDTPDGTAINNGLLNPPQDWVNARLGQYGHNFRVSFGGPGEMTFHSVE